MHTITSIIPKNKIKHLEKDSVTIRAINLKASCISLEIKNIKSNYDFDMEVVYLDSFSNELGRETVSYNLKESLFLEDIEYKVIYDKTDNKVSNLNGIDLYESTMLEIKLELPIRACKEQTCSEGVDIKKEYIKLFNGYYIQQYLTVEGKLLLNEDLFEAKGEPNEVYTIKSKSPLVKIKELVRELNVSAVI